MKRAMKFIAAFALTCTAGLATASVPAQPVANAATPPMTAADLATFFDGLVPYALQRADIAGGAIVVVKDGRLLFARGYGYADLANRKPVSPASTLFRIGSVSKLFTWTAVMQLVEAHKLDLDRDINDYLDFKIPRKFGKPITLRNLMTHTPGFEDTTRDLLPATPDGVNLERYLKTHIPKRIFPPGKIVAYSNYGAGLAGYIVQRVSGERFDDYIQRHILTPLQMRHSTFAQPLPAKLAPWLAKGYTTASDGKPQPFELVNPAPAGAMTASPLDMANFMIAQLQNGRFGDTHILQPATALLMHSRQYTAAPGLNGMDLGFYQENRNGQRIIGHGGDTVVFHSDLHLLLDADVGIFMAFNSAGTSNVRGAIFNAFLERYFPFQAAAQPSSASAKEDATRVAGWYLRSRHNAGALRVLSLLGQTRVAALPDGTLTVSALTNEAGEPLRWREIDPLRYQQIGGQTQLAFVTDADGGIRYLASGGNPTAVLQRLPSSMSMGTFGPLFLAALVVLVTTLLIWLIGWLVRRHYHRALDLTRGHLRARLLSRVGALVLTIVLLGWSLLIACASANLLLLVRDTLVPWLTLLHVLGVLALLGVLAIVANAIHAWLPTRRSLPVRAGECLLAFAAVYLAWFLVAFGLLDFTTRF